MEHTITDVFAPKRCEVCDDHVEIIGWDLCIKCQSQRPSMYVYPYHNLVYEQPGMFRTWGEFAAWALRVTGVLALIGTAVYMLAKW